MEKRLILAITLSLLVLLSWSALVSKTYHIDNKEVTTEKSLLLAPPSSSQLVLPPAPGAKEPAPVLWKFSQPRLDIIFNESQAAITEVIFKDWPNSRLTLQSGLFTLDNSLLFTKENSTDKTVTFVHRDQNKEIVKVFTFSDADYSFRLDIKLQALKMSNLNVQYKIPLVLGVLDFSAQNPQARYQDVAVALQERMLYLNARRDSTFSNLKFLGLRDRYFCLLVEPGSGDYSGFIRKVNAQQSEIGLMPPEITLLPGQTTQQEFRIYLGPQELQHINQIKPGWSAIIHYGTFDFISRMLLQLLEFFFRLVHNWGLAIIILSFVVYFILYPLTLKQMRSMKETQKLQPHIEELRRTYKDNPQKLNKEIMELYRQHKVNPLGGCLPLLLQIPIFFALYQALMRSVALKGATFLWIKDLSEPDRLFLLPTSLPVIGNEVNILPLIMAAGMFFQQKLSLSASSGSAAEQQKLMLILFPVMFGLIFYHMPAGLVLYWFINSALMLVNQFRIQQTK